MKNLLAILGLMMVLFVSGCIGGAEITNDFVEFYGQECPHCQNMKPVVAAVETELGMEFQKLEVWHDGGNRNLFYQYELQVIRDCGGMGVPTYFAVKTEKAVCGEMPGETLKQFVLDNQ